MKNKKIMVVYTAKKRTGEMVENCGIETNAELPLSIDDIRNIEEGIKEDIGAKSVVLLNWFKLGED